LLLWLFMSGDSDRIEFTEEAIDKDFIAGGSMLLRLMTINLILAIFNLLPAFPMDGGRVLRATLSLYMPHLRATRMAASIGQALAFGLGFLGLMGNPWLIFIAVFIWVGAAGEAGYAEMKSIITAVPVRRAMLTEFHTLAEDDSLGHVVNLTLEGSQKDFSVLRGQTVIGVLTQDRLLVGLRESGELGIVGQFMSQDFAEAGIDEDLEAVFKRLQTTSCRLIAVKENGRLSGIINYDNISELISMTKAMDRS
jgi:predicted transcriptional regulator